jgi:hypothetical protein
MLPASRGAGSPASETAGSLGFGCFGVVLAAMTCGGVFELFGNQVCRRWMSTLSDL